MQLITYLSLTFTMFCWGGTFIAGRALSGSFSPASSSFVRFAIATVALFFLTLLVDGRLQKPPKNKWIPLILLGSTGVFSYNILFFNGLQYITAGRASLIIALNPLAITLFAFFLLREKINVKQFFGILLSLTGALFVITNGHLSTLFSGSFGIGELSLLGCVLSWAAYSLIGKTVLDTLTPLSSVFYSSLFGTILLFIPALFNNLAADLLSIDISDMISLGYLGVFGTAVGFTLYYQAIRTIGATRAGVFINLVPFFSIILSWLILDESIKPIVILGGITLLSGVTITNYFKS